MRVYIYIVLSWRGEEELNKKLCVKEPSSLKVIRVPINVYALSLKKSSVRFQVHVKSIYEIKVTMNWV